MKYFALKDITLTSGGFINKGSIFQSDQTYLSDMAIQLDEFAQVEQVQLKQSKRIQQEIDYSKIDLPDIVIPHHNRWDLIGKCLKAIPMQFKVFVVRGMTFSGACNAGAKLSKSKRIIFLNDDAIVNNEALWEMISNKADIVGGSFSYPRVNGIVRGINIKWSKGQFWNGLSFNIKDNSIPSGAFFMIKRKQFDLLGGFNEEYKNGYEDLELFFKAKKAGLKFDYIETPIIHYEAQSDGRYDNTDKNVRLLRKNFSFTEEAEILGYDFPLISALTTKRETDKIMFPESLKNQTYPNIEWIVMEDKYKKGVNYLRNKLVKKAKGDYIFWFDNDLKLEEDYLFNLMTVLQQNPNCDYAYSDYRREGVITGVSKAKPFSYQFLKETNYISGCSLIRKSIFPELDTSIERLQDWDWWLELAEKGYYGVYVPETFFTAYYNKNSISAKNIGNSTFYKQVQIIKDKHKRKKIPFRIYFSKGMALFGNNAKMLWNSDDFDYKSPTLFIGFYLEEDIEALENHNGKKAIFWNGGDVIGLKKNPKLQKLVKGISKQATHNKLLQKELFKLGINTEIRPIFFKNIANYQSSFSQGNNVYLTAHSNREKEYGVNIILKIAPKIPNVNFHIYGVDGQSEYNVIYHGDVSESQMDAEIRGFQGAIRLNIHDGCSQTVLKSILYGQYPITYLPYKHIDQYKTEKELISLIKEIPNKKLPNKIARDYWVNNLNNFDWLWKQK